MGITIIGIGITILMAVFIYKLCVACRKMIVTDARLEFTSMLFKFNKGEITYQELEDAVKRYNRIMKKYSVGFTETEVEAYL